MNQTQNRKVIIKCLTELNEACGGCPPYSATSIFYMLEDNYQWYGAERPVSISQIQRTLSDLLDNGLVVYEMRMEDASGKQGLPQWVKYWQMADAVERNKLIAEVNRVCKSAKKAHGTFFMSKERYFEKPMDAKQKSTLINDLKRLMQKTHPDTVEGFGDQFKQLQESLAYVLSDIDLLSCIQPKSGPG